MGLQIGVVEGVQGISWTEFTVEGQSNHAGTTPMALRQDAALVAAQGAVFVRELTQRMGGSQLATVGSVRLSPTPVHNAPAPAHDDLSLFHNQLSMQAGAYQNGTWVVGVAKAGLEEGVDSIGGSCIVATSGEVVARCLTKGDEMAIARCDLDFCAIYKRTTFNFDLHRQPHAYGLITQRKGETLAADGSPWCEPPVL